jgi:hypothetical protein
MARCLLPLLTKSSCMPQSTDENDSPSLLGCRQRDSALQLGPRKRAYVLAVSQQLHPSMLTQNSAQRPTPLFITATISAVPFMHCAACTHFSPTASYTKWNTRTNPRSHLQKSNALLFTLVVVALNPLSLGNGRSTKCTSNLLGWSLALRNACLMALKRKFFTLQIWFVSSFTLIRYAAYMYLTSQCKGSKGFLPC